MLNSVLFYFILFPLTQPASMFCLQEMKSSSRQTTKQRKSLKENERISSKEKKGMFRLVEDYRNVLSWRKIQGKRF